MIYACCCLAEARGHTPCGGGVAIKAGDQERRGPIIERERIDRPTRPEQQLEAEHVAVLRRVVQRGRPVVILRVRLARCEVLLERTPRREFALDAVLNEVFVLQAAICCGGHVGWAHPKLGTTKTRSV